MTYYTSFVSGFDTLVAAALARVLGDARILSVMDGGILYTTAARAGRLEDLRFATNTFQALAVFRDLPAHGGLASMARQVAGGRVGALRKGGAGAHRAPFRVVASDRNRLVHLPPALLGGVERQITAATRAPLSRTAATQEYWLLTRSDGPGLFLRRITRRRGTHGTLEKGELHPEVAHLLCLMSDPSEGDRFLDPFCGWGSIVLERARSFPYASITACDTDAAKVRRLGARLAKHPARGITVIQDDATLLSGLPDGSISTVVTDPPWGAYEGRDTGGLAARFLARLSRLLAPRGVAVLLLDRSASLRAAVEASPFGVVESRDILLSGRKATAVRLELPPLGPGLSPSSSPR